MSFQQQQTWQDFERLLMNVETLHKVPLEHDDKRCERCKAKNHTVWEKLCAKCRRKFIHYNIEQFIQQKEFTGLCRKIGVRAVAFPFVSVWKQSFRFLPGSDLNQEDLPSYSTRYIHSKAKSEEYSDLIEDLFLVVRRQQKEDNTLDAHTEDFYYMLHNFADQSGPSGAVHPSAFYYCPIGELLFVLYAWRLLSSLDESASKGTPFPNQVSNQFSWRGKPMAEALRPEHHACWEKLHRQLFKGRLDWSHEMKRILLQNKKDKPTPWLISVLTYIKKARLVVTANPKDCVNWDWRRIHGLLVTAAWKYVERLTDKEDLNAKTARDYLERAAPFPIPAFYFWIALDGSPVTYLVSPVWSSPLYPVKYLRRELIATGRLEGHPNDTTYVGFALCATAPLEKWDWTLYGLQKCSAVSRHLRPTVPADLLEFLRLLARPLVELLFYDALTDELLEMQRRQAISAIMARNLSHNVGSHVLANLRLYDSLGVSQKRTLQRLSTFHEYMQERLDFIARALSPDREMMEPLLLVNDILNGFFRQGTLLDCLISDLGYPAKDIEFELWLPGRSDPCRFLYDSAKGIFDAENPRGLHDLLVGIPGGFIGCHAFYAVIENILRNAAKYGKRPPKRKLVLRLRLYEPAEGEGGLTHYSMVISDNVSRESKKNERTVLQKIQDIITAGEINERGELTVQGHGIYEMKACAAYLAGQPLGGSRSSDDFHQGLSQNALKPHHCDDKGFPIKARTRGPRFLGYSIPLRKPILLTLVDPLRKGPTAERPHKNVLSCRKIEDVAEFDSFLSVVIDSGQIDIESLLKSVAAQHQALPYRMLVVTSGDQRAKNWTTLIGLRPDGLPSKRVSVVSDETLLKRFLSASTSIDWDDLILDSYGRWIQALAARSDQPLPREESGLAPFEVCIGFQGRKNRVECGWKKPLKEFKRPDVRIYVSIYDKSSPNMDPLNSGNVERPKSRQDLKKLPKKNAFLIVFDNHGKALPAIYEELKKHPPICYHIFGRNQLSLYQCLERPPYSRFAFQFFILGLIEAAIARIIVVDERVAESTIEKEQQTIVHEKHYNLQRAGIYPILRVGNQFISEEVKSAAMSRYSKRIQKSNRLWKRGASEGISFSKDGPSIRVALHTKNGIVVDEKDFVDIILIHEGLVEGLAQRGHWTEGWETALYQQAPAVLRISGRGREGRILGRELPFLEFSAVSGSTYLSLNKVRLVRAAFATRSRRQPAEKPGEVQ